MRLPCMVVVLTTATAMRRVRIVWCCIAIFGGCTRGGSEGDAPSPRPSSSNDGAVSAACSVDDDCVWSPSCCNDCTSYSGRSAGDAVATRAQAEAARRECERRDEDCPHVNCVSPPPCPLALTPACVEQRCVVKAGPPGGGRDTPACEATACGPLPTFGDPACDGFTQALYERCACIASGKQSCDASMWPSLCAARARCAPADAPPAIAKALAGCQ